MQSIVSYCQCIRNNYYYLLHIDFIIVSPNTNMIDLCFIYFLFIYLNCMHLRLLLLTYENVIKLIILLWKYNFPELIFAQYFFFYLTSAHFKKKNLFRRLALLSLFHRVNMWNWYFFLIIHLIYYSIDNIPNWTTNINKQYINLLNMFYYLTVLIIYINWSIIQLIANNCVGACYLFPLILALLFYVRFNCLVFVCILVFFLVSILK